MNFRNFCRISAVALVSILAVFTFAACQKPAGEQQGDGAVVPNKGTTTTTTMSGTTTTVADNKWDSSSDIPLNDVPQATGSTTTKKVDVTTGTSTNVTTGSTTKATPTTTTTRPSSIELPDDEW